MDGSECENSIKTFWYKKKRRRTNTMSHMYSSIYLLLSLTSFVSPVFSFSSCTVVRGVGNTAAVWGGCGGGDEVAFVATAANPAVCVSISSVFIILALDSFRSVNRNKRYIRTNERNE